MKLINSECPICANEKPMELFICKDCADGISGYTNLLRRVKEVYKIIKDDDPKSFLRDGVPEERVIGMGLQKGWTLDTLTDHIQELED